jgi:preprotein translocase subunit YajC
MGGVRIQPQASRMSLLLMALLTVVIFAVVYFVLTQTAVFGG